MPQITTARLQQLLQNSQRLSKQCSDTKLGKFIQSLPTRPVMLGLILLGGSSCAVSLWMFMDRYGPPKTLVLAAGKESGESYKLSLALAKVVENRQCRQQDLFSSIGGRFCLNFKLSVVDTQGTMENLQALKGKPSNDVHQKLEKAGVSHVHLATAQADLVAHITQYSTASTGMAKPSDVVEQSSTARTVATLYTDFFQLVVSPTLVSPPLAQPQVPNPDLPIKINNAPFSFSSLNGKIIDVPSLGGQSQSLFSVAEHNGLKSVDSQLTEKGIRLTETDPNRLRQDFCLGKIDAVFRVRALGNTDITNVLKCPNDPQKSGVLVPIDQAAAMQIKHPAFQVKDMIIPKGAYGGGENPIPPTDINTIAMKRLLLARKDVPAGVIQELTLVLNDYKSELTENLNNPDRGAQDTQMLAALVTQIREPEQTESGIAASAGVTLHDGARDFYRRNEPPFLLKHLSNASAATTLLSFIALLVVRLRQQLKQQSKDKADDYVNAVVILMKKGQPLQSLVASQQIIETKFKDASEALEKDEISQESFRTFTEAYKTSREYIEREIEAIQRQASEKYIKVMMNLLDTPERTPQQLLEQLDIQFMSAKTELMKDHMFSRESFRTFIEAYNVVRTELARRCTVPSQGSSPRLSTPSA